MTDQERQELLRYMEDFLKRMDDDKELGKELLIEAGIYTKAGKFTEPYQHLPLYFSQIQKEVVL
jgi:hypothetical protein